MKKIILAIVGAAIILPSTSFAIQKFQRTGKIETDEQGGYSETQRDHHSRRSKQIKDKGGSGYYDGKYHSKTTNYRPGEWQFVEPSGKEQPKKYKKVNEKGNAKESQKTKTKKK